MPTATSRFDGFRPEAIDFLAGLAQNIRSARDLVLSGAGLGAPHEALDAVDESLRGDPRQLGWRPALTLECRLDDGRFGIASCSPHASVDLRGDPMRRAEEPRSSGGKDEVLRQAVRSRPTDLVAHRRLDRLLGQRGEGGARRRADDRIAVPSTHGQMQDQITIPLAQPTVHDVRLRAAACRDVDLVQRCGQLGL